ncbi:hypothetical protein OAA90_05405, partial [Salibacteraceae bacterium]|nr:hypothetical protein [Salibacteraceae bacterium]
NIENKVSKNQLLERAFRCLNPINIFPFPNNKYIHYLDGIQYSDLGEENQIQELFAAIIQLHFLKHEILEVREAIKKYYQYLNKEIPSIKTCETIIDKFKNKVVEIVPKEKYKMFKDKTEKPVDFRLATKTNHSISTANSQQKIELSPQTRLKFNALEIMPLADKQVVTFQINADAGRYKSDSRGIQGVFTCRVEEIKTFFNWDNDRNWNNDNTHSWSRFPNWAKAYFSGKLGDEHI